MNSICGMTIDKIIITCTYTFKDGIVATYHPSETMFRTKKNPGIK